MKKAVVVGGSGFVGSHVADYLSNAGYNVVAYDKRPSKWIRQDQSMVIGDIDDIDKEWYFNFYIKPFAQSIVLEFA